ncbi:hypothetical protein, partial [Aminobacterium colombiense]|uniref:hypothetical protein n=1 Tax=Aminobacterium colombiense TaxID=81468 RepID=UPI002598000E
RHRNCCGGCRHAYFVELKWLVLEIIFLKHEKKKSFPRKKRERLLFTCYYIAGFKKRYVGG